MPETNNPAPPQAVDPNVLGLALLNAALTAQIAVMIAVPVPATDIMNLLCEHLGKLLALIEPTQLRNGILAEIRGNLPGVVTRHVEARMRTPGGVLLPEAGQRVQ